MAQTFSLQNSLGAGRQLKSNLADAAQGRELNALRIENAQKQGVRDQQTFDEAGQRRNTEKFLFGISLVEKDLSILPKVAQELASSGIINAESIPPMLQAAQSDPQAFAQLLGKIRSELQFRLGSGPQLGAPQAGVDPQGNAIFGQIDPNTGQSRTVEGIAPQAGGGQGAQSRFFGELTGGLSPEDQKKARRVQLGLDPRAVGSANITIADDEDLTESVADSQATIAQRKKFGEATGSSRSRLIDAGFESINNITANNRNIDRAIIAIDEGASTGAIESRFFPSLRESTIKLEQIQKELGLDVVGGVTFGALSKGELDLALAVALNTGLQPDALRQFLQKKKAANEKLSDYYAEQIDFLDQGGTVAGFLRAKRRNLDAGGQNNDQMLQQAQQAIEAGADPQAVRQRLEELGVDTSQL